MDWRSLSAASRELSRTVALLCAMDAVGLLRFVVHGCATMVDDERRWKRCWPTRRRSPLRALGAGCALAAGCARDALRWWSMPYCAALNFVAVAAAGRPPLRRISGDVVTAGLSSSRVWFGPVPGSP
ncbi:hypothetical protein F511_45320 [Dorcoceras hygrometricum]|uniref:Uncharacterized protein n=1 Tax=Dorcoceras hygrometricum TaxID=472368 RepID=A0A2Z6ZWB2_9LAMI|nr:hypothetical protein F511_45320 [Dorcoceras hygrometricum]